MALPPITIELTVFQKIEILRHEIEKRKEELKETERSIREIMLEVERQKYLKALHALFQQLQEPPQAAQLNDYFAYREALSEALRVMQQSLTALEKESKLLPPPDPKAGAAPAAGAAAGGKLKFDNFESFRNNMKKP